MKGNLMRNIAIVEDEDAAAEVLQGHIEQYAQRNGQEFQICRFHDAVEFLKDYRPLYSVVFMDIQMPHRDGMSAAEELRSVDKTVSLIFITNLVQYAQKGYEVDAIAYLLKPVSYFDFALKFKKALDVYVMNEGQAVTVNTANGLCRISTDKLMYVETVRHRLRYHLVDDVVEVTGALYKVEDEFKGFGFLRCNQCYLVNPKFIVSIKGNTVQVGGDALMISRPRRNAFLAELACWYAGSEGGNG